MGLQSKLEQTIALRGRLAQLKPLSRPQAHQLATNVRIEHVWASNALEGNRLTQPQTASIVQAGITVAGATVRDTLDAINLNTAYLAVMKPTVVPALTITTIQEINRLILGPVYQLRHPMVGYRTVPAWPCGLETHPYMLPQRLEPAMVEFETWLDGSVGKISPVLLAVQLHRRLVTIHPFLDGNGRTARLLMNLMLTQAGYPSVNLHPTVRTAYLERLELARCGNEEPFEVFMVEHALQALRQRIKTLELNEQNYRDAQRETNL
ncbi:Fic family protein [Levilactobacillus acidifarinae]|uniref:Fic family protein n=1 Tax=Levilactobacillus acidifarinae DSM 19394 = JCM 15949 TaxID=1423715 RepID=A0A0R1LT32_9LACO|nr:Fic family protein [Levilactobacillus acidifarinae]KRK96739.1 Fic family protein [Levilactobacillus acidifarinae DSM 19394]GEO69894.1 cell division protein Fic [Levilactobacillus acidifarinae]